MIEDKSRGGPPKAGKERHSTGGSVVGGNAEQATGGHRTGDRTRIPQIDPENEADATAQAPTDAPPMAQADTSRIADRVRAFTGQATESRERIAKGTVLSPRKVRATFKQAAILTEELSGHMARLSEKYEADSTVDPSDALAAFDLASMALEALSQEVEEATESMQEQQCRLAEELASLKQGVNAGQLVERSVLDRIAGATIRIVLSTLLGAVVGGPLIAFVLNDPITSKILEGALGGFVGGVANDLGPIISNRFDGRAVVGREPSIAGDDRTITAIDHGAEVKQDHSSGPMKKK